MSVTLIASDLPHDQMIEQVMHSLSQLNRFSNQVFDVVNNRIGECYRRAQTMNDDILRVTRKIDALQAVKNGISITAPTKFVAQYQGTHCLVKKLSIRAHRSGRQHAVKQTTQKNKISVNKTSERQPYFHFKPSRHHASVNKIIPKNVCSVSDLFLFNTNINIYSKGGKSNNVACSRQGIIYDTQIETKAKQAVYLGDSTLSVNIVQKNDPLFYQPELGTLQEFCLPDDLPDFQGLRSTREVQSSNVKIYDEKDNEASSKTSVCSADSFENATVQGIARLTLSKRNSDQYNQSSVSGTFFTDHKMAKFSDAEDNEKERVNAFPGEESIATESHQSQFSSSTLTYHASQPPPPPPPPPATLNSALSLHSSHDPSLSASPSKSDKDMGATSEDGHASLMDAIRKAGGMRGANLKSIRRKEEEVSALSNRVTGSGGGNDLMSSLAKALETRRKGMAGKVSEGTSQKKSSVSEGAFAKMSAKIPPPPMNDEDDEQNIAKNGDDFEWE